MTKNNNIRTMEQDRFKTQWQHRQQWQLEAEKSVPDDETVLRLIEKAQQSPVEPKPNTISFPHKGRSRWFPYAAAALIVIGLTVVGITRQGQPNNNLPVAKEVTVEGKPIHFLCNNGCSAQDIMVLANEVIK